MPAYVLDTDTITLFLHFKKQQAELVNRILSTQPIQLWVSIITVQEVIGGALSRLNNRRQSGDEMRACEFLRGIMGDIALFQFLPYDMQARQVFDGMTAAEKRVGRNDCKIAAIAMSRGYTVVTRNIKDFAQIRGAACEDWTRQR